MVYRKGGFVKKNEKFMFDNDEVGIVTNYKYLGVKMSVRLSWSPAQKYAAGLADRAFSAIYSVLYKCNFPISKEIMLNYK